MLHINFNTFCKSPNYVNFQNLNFSLDFFFWPIQIPFKYNAHNGKPIFYNFLLKFID